MNTDQIAAEAAKPFIESLRRCGLSGTENEWQTVEDSAIAIIKSAIEKAIKEHDKEQHYPLIDCGDREHCYIKNPRSVGIDFYKNGKAVIIVEKNGKDYVFTNELDEAIDAHASEQPEISCSDLLDALRNLSQDPHYPSMRPCGTCERITKIIHEPFGCYFYQARRKESNSP